MDIPCTRDCPGRSSVCHGSCEKYAAYAKWREEQRRERAKRNRDEAALSRYEQRLKGMKRYLENQKKK